MLGLAKRDIWPSDCTLRSDENYDFTRIQTIGKRKWLFKMGSL